MAKLKITYPTYRQPPHVTFGTGCLRTLAELEAFERTAFFLSGQATVRSYLEGVLAKQGLGLDSSQVITKPPGEPTATMISAGAELLRGREFAAIVGIGGGSVLDWCRLSWASAAGLLDVESGKLQSLSHGTTRPAFWLVPSTCATGAEAADVAVYSSDGRKVPVVSPHLLADRVLLDARFLESLSLGLLAQSLCDALSHAIEGFVSLVPIAMAKEAAVSALRLILQYYAAEAGPSRFERLMDAAYLGGVAASNCSVGVTHAFAHTMARYGVPHALGNALGLEAGIRLNAETPAMAQLLARMHWKSVTELLAAVRPIIRDALDGVTIDEVLDPLAKPAERASTVEAMLADVCIRTNPRRLAAEDIERFLEDVQRTAQETR